MTSANTGAMSYEATHWERGQFINFKTTQETERETGEIGPGRMACRRVF